MLGRNGTLVMGKCEERHFGFLFPCGRCRHKGTGPCRCAAHMACGAGCFAEGCCHRGCERPRGLTRQPLHQLRFRQGVVRVVKATSRGLAAQTSSPHFPFLQEEVFSFLVTPHLELCKQYSLLDVVDAFK